jgi:hypothetical protein
MMNSIHRKLLPKLTRHPSKHRSLSVVIFVATGFGFATWLCVQIAPHGVEQVDAPFSQGHARSTSACGPDSISRVAPEKREELKREEDPRQFDEWATANPREAAAWAQKLDTPESRRSFLMVVALRWAVTDLAAAAVWARSLPEGDLHTEIMAAIGNEAIRSDPEQALGLAAELPSCKAQDDLVCRALVEWAVTERDRAMECAAQIQDKALLEQVTGQIAVASAEKDPTSAANIALEKMPPGDAQDRALVSIIQRWVKTDPLAAASWVKDFPEDQLGKDAIGNLVNLWANSDQRAVGDWLLTLPNGELRNTGIRSYAQVIGRTDPALASRWVGAIP